MALAAVVAVALSACAPSLPNTVVSGSDVRIGWTSELTSTNASSAAAQTSGNLDVDALTRARFTERTNAGPRANESFGTVEIVDQEPFTLRYDLAEPRWSDDVPLDAADLMLAWAAASNAFAPSAFDPEAAREESGELVVPDGTAWFDGVPTGLADADEVPEIDEFARSMEVTLPSPIVDWRTALHVAVPAHVVGRIAFGVDDPMAAKERVLDAIRTGSPSALADIAAAWNDGFGIGSGEDADRLLSSGPYAVESVGDDGVELVVNPRYDGTPTAVYERVSLVVTNPGSLLSDVGDSLDVVQVAPVPGTFTTVRDLERRDYGRYPSQSGRIWVLALRVDRGVFASLEAREAFLRAVPRDEALAAGAGEWGSDHTSTDALLFGAGTADYQVAIEDSGFQQRYTSPSDDEAALERLAAGVADGTAPCVLVDRESAFATAAVEAMRVGMAETGWGVQACPSADVAAAIEGDQTWDAVLTTVEVPTSVTQLRAQWGTGGAESLTGNADVERDALIDEYAATADAFAARDLLVDVETTIVDDAVALPLGVDPRIAVAAPSVTGVDPRDGADASLAWSVVTWSPPDD